MAIANVAAVAYLGACIKTGQTVVEVKLDGDLRYRLLHTGLNEDLGADTERVLYRTRESDMADHADLAAATTLSGLLGEGLLAVVANQPDLAVDYIGPRVESVQFFASGQGAPVVKISPVGVGGRQ